jgi:hypothetical protein
MGEAEDLMALEYIQAAIVTMRQMAAETDNPRIRDAFLRAADSIEKNVRELDRHCSRPALRA